MNASLSSTEWKLIGAATVGAISTFLLLSASNALAKRSKVAKIKAEFKSLSQFPPLDDPVPPIASVTRTTRETNKVRHVPEELVREQLSRNYSFLGEEGMSSLRSSFVIVIGLGGVGSHAAHMLVRSGVQRLRLIDFDQVSLSSLNRHAVAVHADVGVSKAECLKKHFEEIAPQADVEAVVELFSEENAGRLLDGNPDYVLDCIDNLATKIHLLHTCHTRNIPVISSMGAGAKADPSRIQIADISDTTEDALARATRKGLRMVGVDSGVTVVYSTERPGRVGLLPLEEAKVEEAGEYATLPNFRARILPVLGSIPALFGMAMASFVICKLAKYEMDPLPVKLRRKVYDRVFSSIKMNKKPENGDLQINLQDIGYILDETFHGKSVLSGSADREKVTLTRWDASKPWRVDNLVAMTKAECDKHAAVSSENVKGVYGEEVVEFVEKKLREVKELEKWRMRL